MEHEHHIWNKTAQQNDPTCFKIEYCKIVMNQRNSLFALLNRQGSLCAEVA